MSGDDGLMPGQLPPGILRGREEIRRRAAAETARWGGTGPAALAYRWALGGGEDCPVGRSYWPEEMPSPADIESEAQAPSRWPAGYEAEIVVARRTLWWLVHDRDGGWPDKLAGLITGAAVPPEREVELWQPTGPAPAARAPGAAVPGAPEGGGRVWLDVPLTDWRKAKAAGARWDSAARRWYAPRPGLAELRWWQPLPEHLAGEDRTFSPGLFVDPVPRSCWFTDTRTCLRPDSGKRVQAMVVRRAGRRCEACGQQAGENDAARLAVHERWEYRPGPGVQRLRRLVCLCAACHQATHFGLVLRERRWGDPAFRHLLAVTGLSAAAGRQHVNEAVAWSRQVSKRTWALDLSMLTGLGLRLSRAALQARDGGAGAHPGRIG